MRKHNFDYSVSWEVVSPNGNIVAKSHDIESVNIEGTVRTSIVNRKGQKVFDEETPMRSYTVGFLESFVNGIRLAANTNFQTLPMRMGAGNSPTYVQQIQCCQPFVDYSNSVYTAANIASSDAGMSIESLSEGANSIIATIGISRTITSGSGTLREVAFFAADGNMVSRDVVPDAAFNVGDTITITLKLHFPHSSYKTVTKNWVYNFLQNIASPYTDYKTTSGTAASGVANITSGTFAKEVNTRGAADDDTMGLVIGTGSTAASWDNYALGSQIANGSGSGQMQYSAMPETNYIAKIQPLAGSASVTYYREFTNASGNAITVKEGGLIAKTALTSEGIDTAGAYLLARWILPNVVVENGNTLKLYFRPKIYATPENHSGLDSEIVILTDELRASYPRLAYVSMVIKRARRYSDWSTSMSNADINSKSNYFDWRISCCTSLASNNTPQNELYGLYLAKTELSLGSPNAACWSSNQHTATNAKFVQFLNGTIANQPKTTNNYIYITR